MARINPDLFAKIMERAELEQAAVYRRITKKANERYLSRDLAALAVAADLGIPINKYGTRDQLEELRRVTSGHSPTASVSAPRAAAPKLRTSTERRPVSKAASNTVFVVHGRDQRVSDSMFQFLHALKLNPIEWNTAVGYTKNAAPHISKVLDAAFRSAVAAVILFTPDDEARLQTHFHNEHDEATDTEYRGQARPNVFFEAGMAVALRPKSTVLVEVGKVRKFTDISGMHVVRLSNAAPSRHGMVTKLKNAGLTPDTSGTQWMTVGDFTPTAPAKPPQSGRRTVTSKSHKKQ